VPSRYAAPVMRIRSGGAPATHAGLLLAVGSLALAGCSLNSPVQTQVPYQPGDGVEVNLGSIAIRNLLVVASGPQAPGRVAGLVVNSGATPQTVTISAPDGTKSTSKIPAGATLDLSAAPGAVVLRTAGAPAGGVVQLKVSTPGSGTDDVGVPVLLPQFYYSTLTPTGSPTSGSTPSTPGAVPSTAETGGQVTPETNSQGDRP